MSERKSVRIQTGDVCSLCGNRMDSHNQRCRKAVFAKGQVQRCLGDKGHNGECIFRNHMGVVH